MNETFLKLRDWLLVRGEGLRGETSALADAPEGRAWPWILVIASLAFALRFGLALRFPNTHRPDEIFNNLEPAFRIWSGHGVKVWEWRDGIRSSMYPGFIAGLIAISSWLGMGAAGYIAVIAGVFSLVSTAVVVIAVLVGRREFGWAGGLVCGVLCAVWPDLVYFGPKALAEVQVGNLLLIAAFLATYRFRTSKPEAVVNSNADPMPAWQMFATGLVLGLAFCVRFHLALSIGLVGLWACRLSWRRWLFVGLGFAIPVLVMGFIDQYMWGTFLVTVWRSYQANITQHISDGFGTTGRSFYVRKLFREWTVAIFVVGATFLTGMRRAPLFAALAAMVFVSHSLIAHKEISFIYAAIPPAILVAGLGTVQIIEWRLPVLHYNTWPRTALVWIVVLVWARVSYNILTSERFRPNWYSHSTVLRAQAMIRDEPSLCGMGLEYDYPRVTWISTGGDFYLGKGVPIYEFQSKDEGARIAPAINAALGGRDVAEKLPGFSIRGCVPGIGREREVCVASTQRQTCIADPSSDLNSVPNLGRWNASAPGEASGHLRIGK